MATNKREFMQMYDEAVQLLKKYKQQNDSFNKSIGIQHNSSLAFRIRSEQSVLQQMLKRLDELLSLLQESYLDPQTARRIGTIKQQYRIQKDRRQHIMKEIQQLGRDEKIMHKQNSDKQAYMEYQLTNTKHDGAKDNNSKRNYRSNRNTVQQQNQITRVSLNNKDRSFTEEQLTKYDYEIECKILNQKNQNLEDTEKRIRNVYHITNQTKQMVYYQGEHLDIISDQIFKTKSNLQDALGEIKEANELSKKRNRKIIFGVSFLVLILAIVVLVVAMG